MDRECLARKLGAGRSIESIAHDVGKHPSTVSYWIKRFGLSSTYAARHAPRAGIDREQLEALVSRGLSSRQIADHVGMSQSTVRHWLQRHGLRTERARRDGPRPAEVLRTCVRHGEAVFVRYGASDHYRCLRCRRERVVARRRKVKEILIAEAGGGCASCGYDRYAGALHFHHVNAADKEFNLALNGIARSLDRARREAAKCILLCANCHAEVESGIV